MKGLIELNIGNFSDMQWLPSAVVHQLWFKGAAQEMMPSTFDAIII